MCATDLRAYVRQPASGGPGPAQRLAESRSPAALSQATADSQLALAGLCAGGRGLGAGADSGP